MSTSPSDGGGGENWATSSAIICAGCQERIVSSADRCPRCGTPNEAARAGGSSAKIWILLAFLIAAAVATATVGVPYYDETAARDDALDGCSKRPDPPRCKTRVLKRHSACFPDHYDPWARWGLSEGFKKGGHFDRFAYLECVGFD